LTSIFKNEGIQRLVRRTAKLGSLLVQVLTQAVALAAFLAGINYFSKVPSVQHDVRTPIPIGYSLEDLQEFYTIHDIKMPDVFSTDPKLRELFFKEQRRDVGGIDAGMSNTDLIDTLKQKKWASTSVSAFLEKRIINLEKHIDKYEYRKRIYVFDGSPYVTEADFDPVREYLKKQLSQEDYFVFLNALIYTRKISNSVYLKNNGGLDLVNLKIYVSFPLTTTSESRNDNMLSHEYLGRQVHQIRIRRDYLEAEFPKLARGEHVNLLIVTRENRISESDVWYTYQAERSIDQGRVLWNLSIIVIVLIILRLPDELWQP
jgi:hypothetical protein